MENSNPLYDLSNQDIEKLYPELYYKLKPHIDEIAYLLSSQTQQLDETMIEEIVQDILMRSGLSQYMNNICNMNMDTMDDLGLGTAVAVDRTIDYKNILGGLPNRKNATPNYQRNTSYYDNPLNQIFPFYPVYPNFPADIARIMFQRRLGRYNPYY